MRGQPRKVFFRLPFGQRLSTLTTPSNDIDNSRRRTCICLRSRLPQQPTIQRDGSPLRNFAKLRAGARRRQNSVAILPCVRRAHSASAIRRCRVHGPASSGGGRNGGWMAHPAPWLGRETQHSSPASTQADSPTDRRDDRQKNSAAWTTAMPPRSVVRTAVSAIQERYATAPIHPGPDVSRRMREAHSTSRVCSAFFPVAPKSALLEHEALFAWVPA